MTFQEVWQAIQLRLTAGSQVKNWTVAKGYLGDSFKIVTVSSSHVDVDSPNAETVQRVSKKDFEFMHDNWYPYCAGKVRRTDLVKSTRVSKYTISILRHLGV
jgi:hypothetical protein